MSQTQYRQFRLTQGDSELVCWLVNDPRLKRGVSITLGGFEGWWRIEKPYSTLITRPPETQWDVGGL